MLKERDGEAVVLLNDAAGGARDDTLRVIAAFRRAGIEAEVRTVKPSELTTTARDLIAAGTLLVVAAGGDGTVNAVASAVIGSQAVLGVLPVGTLDHFARDLGLPADLDLAVQVLASGQIRGVDVGEVNGRVFVNNCSIGLYPSLVVRRERQRQRLAGASGLPCCWRFSRCSSDIRSCGLRWNQGAASSDARCRLVFVGNNPYETDLLNIGRRHSLSG